ncbi:MAG: hypothetical protein KGD64_00605 [Candidatus Heimdallarchaeota archaeon]|nr:hypothetical protein [Candidatus Heimdallarchaeota archaeon]
MLHIGDKSIKLRYIIIPLILSSICFITIYSNDLTIYYGNYDEIISDSITDYMVIKENVSYLYTEDYKEINIQAQLQLDKYSHMGFMSSIIEIEYTETFPVTVIWAPEEFYINQCNLSIEENEFLIDSALRDKNWNISQSLITSFQFEGGINVNSTLLLQDFIPTNKIAQTKILEAFFYKYIDENCIFINDNTFDNLFGGYFSQIETQEAFIFKFKRSKIYSQPIEDIITYLATEEEQIRDIFEVDIEDIDNLIYQYSLKGQLELFNSNFKEVRIIQRISIYLLVSIIIILSLILTSRGYLNSQKNKIALFKMRGGKDYQILQAFVSTEVRASGIVFILSYIYSLIYLRITVPLFLRFDLNYAKLAGTVLAFVLLSGSFQVFLLTQKTRSATTEENIEVTLFRKFYNIAGEMFILLIPIVFATLFFISIYTQLFSNETDISYWVFGIFSAGLLIFSLLLNKNRVLKIGVLVNLLFAKFCSVFNYTKNLSKKVLTKERGISKLLVIYVMIISLFFSLLDSFAAFNIRNEEYNEIGDLTIVYPIESSNDVYVQLSDHVDSSIDFYHTYFSTDYISLTDTQGIISLDIDGFIINQSKIQNLFDSQQYKEEYSGGKNIEYIKQEFENKTNSAIIPKGLSELINKSTENAFSYEHPSTGNLKYTKEIIDVIDIIPTFSWLSFYYRTSSPENPYYVLLNSNNSDVSSYESVETFSILFLKNGTTKEQFISLINLWNNEYHYDISVIDFGHTKLVDSDYSKVFLRPEQLITMIIILSILLSYYIFEYCRQVFNEQLDGYSVFFARGTSIKQGIFFALVPLLLFLYSLMVFGNLFGWIFTTILSYNFQPYDYLKIKVSIFPYSLLTLLLQFVYLTAITSVSGFIHFKKLKEALPTIKKIDNPLFELEEQK